jgi:hypothetical protein
MIEVHRAWRESASAVRAWHVSGSIENVSVLAPPDYPSDL